MSFPYYQSAGQGWGTSQYRFGPPPAPQFQPQPSWRGIEFYRAHAFNPDTGLFESALERVRNYEGAAGVGVYEARRFHRMIYGGLIDITTVPPSEIGHAAAYEAFRIWRHHGFVCRPLGGDIERQRECLMALAVAEATRLRQYSGRVMDRVGTQVACDAAASTGSLIFGQEEMAAGSQVGGSKGQSGGMGQFGGMNESRGMSGSRNVGMNGRMGGGMGGMGANGMGVGGFSGGMSAMDGGRMGGAPGRYGMPDGMGSPHVYDEDYAYTGTPALRSRSRALSAPGTPGVGISGRHSPMRSPNPFNEGMYAGNGMGMGGMGGGMGMGNNVNLGAESPYGRASGIAASRSMPGSPQAGHMNVPGANPMPQPTSYFNVYPGQNSAPSYAARPGMPMVGVTYPGVTAGGVYSSMPAGGGAYPPNMGVQGGGYSYPGGLGGSSTYALPGLAQGQSAGFQANSGYPGMSGVSAYPVYVGGSGYSGGTTYAVQPGSTVNIVPGKRRHRLRRHSTAGRY